MYSNVLIPVSFDEERDAEGAIDVARVLQAEGGTLTLMHVIEQLPNYALAYLPLDYLKEQRRAIEEQVREMAAKVPGATAAVVNGHAGRAITDWAQDNGVDCIVMASHRPGMQDLLLGSTAHYVVRHAACAVHVVR